MLLLSQVQTCGSVGTGFGRKKRQAGNKTEVESVQLGVRVVSLTGKAFFVVWVKQDIHYSTQSSCNSAGVLKCDLGVCATVVCHKSMAFLVVVILRGKGCPWFHCK